MIHNKKKYYFGFCHIVQQVCLLFLMLAWTSVQAEENLESRALVIATEKVAISSEIAARIQTISFLKSESFQKGDKLIVFNCDLYEAQRDVMAANFESAQLTVKNNKQLLTMKSIGNLEVELSKVAVEKARAELSITELNLERCTIHAPFDGRIIDIYVDEHASIQQQQPLMDIVGNAILEAMIVVPSHWLQWLELDHQVKIIIDETGGQVEATIKAIGATVDAASQTIELRAVFNQRYDDLLPGMSGTVLF